MARLIRTIENQLVTCDVITHFADGTSSRKSLKVGDVVEGLRYIENKQLLSVSGRISSMIIECNNVTPISAANPVDNFGKDAKISSIIIDASTEYHSNVVTVNAREIVEDAGVLDVVKVDVIAVPSVTLEMSYTDGTTVQQAVIVGDVLGDMVIMTSPGKPDIEGDFRVAAFKYSKANKQGQITFTGMYLVPLEGGECIYAGFDSIIRFTEKNSTPVDTDDSLSEIANALSENDEVYAFIDTDVNIPLRDDGKITTLMIDSGKSLTVDLNGHNINTQAYAFYVNGGTLTIRDTTGEGRITASIPDKAYPAVYVASDGVCNMENGIIDTTRAELAEGQSNWLYGVVCSGNGTFNMTGGQIITQDAAGISITNGTATGAGAQFDISGDAIITSNDCTAIYLADKKAVNISGKAKINGGILLRMGDLTVSENAVVNGVPGGADVYPLGTLATESGCETHSAAILAMTGCYGSDLGNDLNVKIKDKAKINSYIDNAIDVAMVDTNFNQIVNINIEKAANVKYANKLWNVYLHDQLAEMATEQGKTLQPKMSDTTLTVIVDGTKVYPML